MYISMYKFDEGEIRAELEQDNDGENVRIWLGRTHMILTRPEAEQLTVTLKTLLEDK